jgi:integrase
VKTWPRKGGDVGYALRFTDQHGVRQHERCGLASEGWSLQRAEILLAQRLDEVARGAYAAPQEPLDEDDADPLFGLFAPAVLAEHAVTVAPNTRDFNSNMLRNHLLPELAKLRLSEITYERIDAYKRRRLQLMHQIRAGEASGIALRRPDGRRVKLSERTINHSIAVLDFILSEAVRRRSIALTHNEARDRRLRVKIPKKAVRDWLEGDELLQLLDLAPRTDDPTKPETVQRAAEVRRLRDDCGLTIDQTAKAMSVAKSTVWLLYSRRDQERVSQARTVVAILSASGARNTEICLLRPIDLDFAHGKIRVAKSKTRKGVREIDMTPWLRTELKRWVAHLGGGYDPLAPLFVNRLGNAFNKDTLNDLIQRVYDEAARERAEHGAPPLPTTLTAHVFRRTYITHMLEAGAPPSYVQEQVGHEDARTTLEIYSRVLRNRDRRRHVRAFDEIMRGAVPLEAAHDPADEVT